MQYVLVLMMIILAHGQNRTHIIRNRVCMLQSSFEEPL